jgi:hypothetical protein
MPKDSLKRSSNQPSSQDNRAILLKQELSKWEAYNRLQGNPDYQQYLKPLLEQAFHNLWPDPAQQDFERKYIIEYSRAKAYKEIYDLLSTSKTMIENIRKQMSEPEKNYAI